MWSQVKLKGQSEVSCGKQGGEDVANTTEKMAAGNMGALNVRGGEK